MNEAAVNSIELSLFVSRIQAICQEMGAVLQYSAFSPNIKDRLDFSCAIFDARGELCAQAAHIPVHLGSMAFAMRDIVSRFQWQDGDMLILNDPFLGGTHLPDITLLAPVFNGKQLLGFAANRAHHADVGATTPGSMPLTQSIHEEGVLIPPGFLYRNHELLDEATGELLQRVHIPEKTGADLSAQVSSIRKGVTLFKNLISDTGSTEFESMLVELNDYGEKLALTAINAIPEGTYTCHDVMDDDGLGSTDIPIAATINISNNLVSVDFDGTADQVRGNINCPISVTAAAVYYCFYSLMPEHTPACAGCFRPIQLIARPGSLVNAAYPAAVTAGNVETSTRLVDVILGALAGAIPDRIPAASHGSMNNLAMGTGSWDYYETLGGGMGAGPTTSGQQAVQTHMTNTLNTPIEILEMNYPLRIKQYGIRRQSGGRGRQRGGDGLIRQYQFLQPCTVTMLSERRRHAPPGLAGGSDGLPAETTLNGSRLPGKFTIQAASGDILTIRTAGGGGWGCDTSPD